MYNLKVRTLLRVNKCDQSDQEDILRQRSMCNEFIAMNEYWKLDHEYIDIVSSKAINYKDQLKILRKIMFDAEENQFDILVVSRTEHLASQEPDLSLFVCEIYAHGVDVYSVQDGQLNIREHRNKLSKYMAHIFQFKFKKTESLWAKSMMQNVVKNGRFVGKHTPYGYSRTETGREDLNNISVQNIVIDEEKAKIVKEIYSLATVQMYSSYKIAKTLNERGIRNENGNEWQAVTIYQMLRNPLYKGIISYNGEKVKSEDGKIIQSDYIPEYAIITADVWEKAQEIRTSRQQSSANRSNMYLVDKLKSNLNAKDDFLLLGFTYCGYCGGRLTNGSSYDHLECEGGRKVKRRITYYRCSSRRNDSITCKEKVFIQQEELEYLALAMVDNYFNSFSKADLLSLIWKLHQQKKIIIEKELKTLLKREKSLKDKIDTLSDDIPAAIRGEYRISLKDLAQLLDSSEQELEELKKEISMKESEASYMEKLDSYIDFYNSMPDWKQAFRQLDTQTKKVILAMLIERIDVYVKEIKIKFKFSIENFKYE